MANENPVWHVDNTDPKVPAVVAMSSADLKDTQVIDLDKEHWDMIKKAAMESKWMPPEYMMNDWVSDVCAFLREPNPIFKALPNELTRNDAVNSLKQIKEMAVRYEQIKDPRFRDWPELTDLISHIERYGLHPQLNHPVDAT